jgi:hypothetical protein
MTPTGRPVRENLVRILNRGDAWGLGPYHGSDSDPQPGSALCVSLSSRGEAEDSQTLRTDRPRE